MRDDPVSKGELTNVHDLYSDDRVTTIPLRGSPEVVLVEQWLQWFWWRRSWTRVSEPVSRAASGPLLPRNLVQSVIEK